MELLKIIDSISEHIDGESFLHSEFRQDSSKTFRIYSSNYNLQNVVKDQQIRKCFVSRDGYVFIGGDFSQFQLRIIAHLALVEDIKSGFADVLLKNGDVHQETSDALDVDRNLGKKINFACCYGAHVARLKDALGLKLFKCSQIYEGWHNKYPEVRSLFQKYIGEIMKTGCVKSTIGQSRYFDQFQSLGNTERNKIGWIGFNAVVQMMESFILKITILTIFEKLEKFDFKLVLIIHDELLFEVLEKDASELKDIILDEMENAVKLEVPVKANVKIGKNWYEVH